jgi:hypothetical protein
VPSGASLISTTAPVSAFQMYAFPEIMTATTFCTDHETKLRQVVDHSPRVEHASSALQSSAGCWFTVQDEDGRAPGDCRADGRPRAVLSASYPMRLA